jgi:hypothetical protein
MAEVVGAVALLNVFPGVGFSENFLVVDAVSQWREEGPFDVCP